VPVERYDAVASGALTLPITIYISDEGIHEEVEAAVAELLAIADLRIVEQSAPVVGSWFRSIRAGIRQAIHSPAAQDAALTAAHAADARLSLAQDAHITATLLHNLGPVIASLQPTKDAVLRVGALIIVKTDWAVQVHQLTAAQQLMLDHQPRLASSPHEIIAVLQLLAPATEAYSNKTPTSVGLVDSKFSEETTQDNDAIRVLEETQASTEVRLGPPATLGKTEDHGGVSGPAGTL
jgi:hypothetical protein